jgi:hypothetical protein
LKIGHREGSREAGRRSNPEIHDEKPYGFAALATTTGAPGKAGEIKGKPVNVNVLTAGALTHSLPEGKTVVAGEDLTVKRLLDLLVARYGPAMEHELMSGGELREGLVLLVNGRNVLSLPGRFASPLRDGDEVLITIMVAGG